MPRFKVVAIGGGTGLSAILRGLKELPFHLVAIVTVADDGGSSGILREELNMPPPGDLRNVLIALAEAEPLLAQLMQHRFKSGSRLMGHPLGNLLIAAMHEIMGDFNLGIKALNKVLAVKGQVLPAANEAIILKAELADGSIITGESIIPKSGKKIKRVFIANSDVTALYEAVREILTADVILIGPGSLYTSLLPNLLVPGIVDAIMRSEAKKIYICNVMTEKGETEGFRASDHLQVIIEHIGLQLFDTVYVNKRLLHEEILSNYLREGAKPVEYDEANLKKLGIEIIADDFLIYDASIKNKAYARHDSSLVGKYLLEVLRLKKQKIDKFQS